MQLEREAGLRFVPEGDVVRDESVDVADKDF